MAAEFKFEKGYEYYSYKKDVYFGVDYLMRLDLKTKTWAAVYKNGTVNDHGASSDYDFHSQYSWYKIKINFKKRIG